MRRGSKEFRFNQKLSSRQSKDIRFITDEDINENLNNADVEEHIFDIKDDVPKKSFRQSKDFRFQGQSPRRSKDLKFDSAYKLPRQSKEVKFHQPGKSHRQSKDFRFSSVAQGILYY